MDRTGDFEPLREDYAERVADGFEAQTFMRTIGATLGAVGPGSCEVRLPFRKDLCQHTGFVHAGVTTTIADNACGFAALTLMPENSEVLSIEFKVNLLRPAVGEELVARARVVKPGRNVSVVQADVFAVSGGREKPVAFMLATMMRVDQNPVGVREPAG